MILLFYHRTNKRPTEPSDHGRKEKNTYGIEIDERGHKSVKKTGETNLYEKIQQSADSTNIELIIKRATLGDTTALNKYQTVFADITNAPTSLAEAQNSIIKLNEVFGQLPLEIRSAYDHSPEKFIADFGSEKFMSLMNPTPETPPTEVPNNE